MRSDLSDNISEEKIDPSRKNAPYLIGKTAFATEWTLIPIKLHQNLFVFEPTQENYNIQ